VWRALLCLLFRILPGFFKIAGQVVQLLFPELFVESDPFGGVAQALRLQSAVAHAAVLFAGQEPGTFKHAYVLHDAGQGDVEPRRKLRDARFPKRELREDGPAGGIGQSAESGIERGL
jgi:hypothetical protein